MSNLTFTEKRKLEQLLGMKTGYVLDFSDRTFGEFVSDATGRNIFDERYNYASGSKANRLRAFWQKEDNATVGKLMGEMLNYSEQTGPLAEVCRLIVARMLQDGSAVSPAQAQAQDKQQEDLDLKRSQVLRQLKDEFLANSWQERAFAAQKKVHVPAAWWGREDWKKVRDMGRDDRRDAFVDRFKRELSYKSVKAWPIYGRNNGGALMYYMIHATDHPEAPKLMSRAYHATVSPSGPFEQPKLFPEPKNPASEGQEEGTPTQMQQSG